MIIYGKNIIKEAIKAKRPIYQLYIDLKMKDPAFLCFLQSTQVIYKKVDKHFLNEKTQNQNHQGAVALVQDYGYSNLISFLKNKVVAQKKFLILDNIQDPHNFGAILRTLETTDFDGVIISKKHQVLLNSTVAKAASGALEYVRVFLVSNLYQTLLVLKEYQVMIIGTSLESNSVPFYNVKCSTSLALVLGNEGIGIRPLLKKNCDILATIPMQGKINSLNVSVAAALFMYGLK